MDRDKSPMLADPSLEALWKRVLDDWENDAAHGAFLEYCQAADQLLEAAVRYKGMSGDSTRGESAQKRLQGVALLAMSKLESSRTPSKDARGNAARLVLIIFFAAASIALGLYATR
jgi:hypothetical protein